jgi:hypothetical protein
MAHSGPSVLYIPEQRPAGEANWSWCAPPDARSATRCVQLTVASFTHRGRGTKGEAAPESASEREATRHAVGAGLDEAIAAQLRATEHANRLREEARQEAAELRQAARGGGAGVRAARALCARALPRAALALALTRATRLVLAAAAAEREGQREGQAVL